ncbi:MAG: thiamine diphosphokinase [Oscillospiraceae bacterium]|jgi:thiamine pyrophosphokinase|nr:thiamine diphosphokinase [Oscillospiraceae bacterium]
MQSNKNSKYLDLNFAFKELGDKRCVLLGAAPVKNLDFINNFLHESDFIICVDGGLNLQNKLKFKVDLIVGDMDSKTSKLPKSNDIVFLNKEKDETDMMAAAKQGLSKGFDKFAILAGVGGRLDHTYANFCTLNFLAKNGANAILADEYNRAFILLEGFKILFDTFAKNTAKYVSIFPFGCKFCQVTGEGFKYRLDDAIKIFIHESRGISNEITDERARLSADKGTALVFSSSDQAFY